MPEDADPTQEQDVDELLGGSDDGDSGGESKKGIIIIAITALISAGAGVGVVVFLLTPPAQADEGQSKEKQAELEKIAEDAAQQEKTEDDGQAKVLYTVDDITANISGTGMRRFVRASFTFELKDKEIEAKAKTKPVELQIKDRLLAILSSKTLEDFDGSGKKDELKREVRLAISGILGGPDTVKAVYVPNLLVQ